MEGAGPSIVSDPAQVVTREVDSADEEPELSSDLQDFIRRLEGKGEPITSLTNFEPSSLSTILGPRSQMRLRVLKAIGNCNTLEYLELKDICDGDISTLTASEWDVVLSGFRCSTVLREIRISFLRWSSDEEVERLCLELGRILNTSTVKYLQINNCRLSARCYLNLASGMRGKSETKLESLELHDAAWEDSSAVKHVADMINSATRLEMLSLGSTSPILITVRSLSNTALREMGCDMNEKVVRTMSQAINESSSLKTLRLVGVTSEASAFLQKAFASDNCNRSIEHLEMRDMRVLGNCVRDFLIYKELRLKEVTLVNIYMPPEEWRVVGEAIRVNTTVKTIKVSSFHTLKVSSFQILEGLEELACAASSDNKDPIMQVSLSGQSENLSQLNILGKVLRGEIKSIKSFRFWCNTYSTYFTSLPWKSSITDFQERLESIFPMNRTSGDSSVLESLSLRTEEPIRRSMVYGSTVSDEAKIWWKHLFLFLRGNTTLTHLTLAKSEASGENINEEVFRDLMGLLQVNLSLQEIDVSDTSWARDGKAAQIQEALKQNQKRAEYMSVFRDAKLTFGDAKAGRLFLCGSPRAGKTQLRQTLMRIVQDKSWLRNEWDKLKWRTRGIEVEFLENSEKSQISIWDFGGQEMFRTLQNVLFPQTINFCVFIFVYSPFRRKPQSSLQAELKEWLSFISSSARVTGHNRPQVLVVISHKDKTKITSLKWAESIVDQLAKRFAKFVDLHPIQEIFHVDARKKKQVIFLKDHIFEIFQKLLSEKSPLVPQLCSEISSLLVKKTKENRSFPLWSSTKFYEFCAPSLKKFIPNSSPHADDHSRILKSIISYLNDVGSIVSIQNLDYIVVDPNWLTNTLLGELVALGHSGRSGSSRKKIPRDLFKSSNGFVGEDVFASLIEKFLGRQPHGERGVDREMIENILINLDLCFKLEDPLEYFIPSFIPEHASKEEQKHQQGTHVRPMTWKTKVDNPKFVGIRVQCQDELTMSLTAAFFPCFQMFMRRKLISEMDVSKDNVTCCRHYLEILLDGRKYYVEQGTSHKYVDVLMLYSKYKSRERALKYVMKDVVQELISFCASPKGCPGVALVLGVIQPICVEMLIPSHLRGTILIEDLKSQFIRSINEDDLLEKSHLEKEDELFNYEHSWPMIKGHTTECTFERARELLSESDMEAVVKEIQQKRMQQLELMQQCGIQQLKSLKQGISSVNNDLVLSHPDMKDSNQSSSRWLSQESTIVEDRSTQVILSRLDQIDRYLVQRFDGVDERLGSVVSIGQRLEIKVGQIISLQQELQSTLSDFNSKVDSMIQYSESLKQARTPKRPYVTTDVGVLYKFSAGMHLGTTVRLHLMCESITEPEFHMVKDQEGLKIRLDWENCKWIRRTVEIMYKVMYLGAKAGLAKFVQLGQAIPDWADLTSDIVKLVSISDEDRRAILKGEDSKELQEAWLRIQHTLAPHLQNRYSELFRLYPVRYDKAGHAWVCEECMKNGLSSRVLTC